MRISAAAAAILDVVADGNAVTSTDHHAAMLHKHKCIDVAPAQPMLDPRGYHEPAYTLYVLTERGKRILKLIEIGT